MTPLPIIAFALAGLYADIGGDKSELPLLDSVVAVVGERPIFLSELRRRPEMHLINVTKDDEETKKEAVRTAYGDTIQRIIQEWFVEREAAKASLSVTPAEVDAGVAQVATSSKMTNAELLAELKRRGVLEADYRDLVRLQLLEAKLIEHRVVPRVHVTDENVHDKYNSWVYDQTGPSAPIHLRILALRVPDPSALKATEALAAQIVAKVKSGADFCALVTKHSSNTATTSMCGSLGWLDRYALPTDFVKAGSAVKPGEVAAPISFAENDGAQYVLIIQRAPGAPTPPIPDFESVKAEMNVRAYESALRSERQYWWAETRRDTYVHVTPW